MGKHLEHELSWHPCWRRLSHRKTVDQKGSETLGIDEGDPVCKKERTEG